MTSCRCDVGQKCVLCEKRGSRDGVFPDPAIPESAWCAEHGALPIEERIAIWQAAVKASEERERAET